MFILHNNVMMFQNMKRRFVVDYLLFNGARWHKIWVGYRFHCLCTICTICDFLLLFFSSSILKDK